MKLRRCTVEWIVKRLDQERRRLWHRYPDTPRSWMGIAPIGPGSATRRKLNRLDVKVGDGCCRQ